MYQPVRREVRRQHNGQFLFYTDSRDIASAKFCAFYAEKLFAEKLPAPPTLGLGGFPPLG
jgi:hypothetical protein